MAVKQKYVKVLFWISAIVVLVLSSMPGTLNYSVHNLDKLAHLLTFFSLSILLLFSYKFAKPFFTTASLMALFGLVIEILQRYVPNRVFSMTDFAADILGIALALILFRILGDKITIA
ncbi:MAG: VanZ family protein [Gammaproteobacteria bacterium]